MKLFYCSKGLISVNKKERLVIAIRRQERIGGDNGEAISKASDTA